MLLLRKSPGDWEKVQEVLTLCVCVCVWSLLDMFFNLIFKQIKIARNVPLHSSL